MYKKKKIFALIIARKNSSRLKNKNLLPLKKKPLFYWTVKCALRSKYIDKICLSSDIEKINLFNLKSKKVFLDKRPKYLATSNSSVYKIINYIEKKYIKKNSFQILVLLQATSPFRTSENIDNAIKKYCMSPKAKSLISVMKLDKKYNYIISGKKTIEMPLRSKKRIYVPNGAIFIKNAKDIKFKTFYSKMICLYEMPFVESIDIDYFEDYKIAKCFQKKLK